MTVLETSAHVSFVKKKLLLRADHLFNYAHLFIKWRKPPLKVKNALQIFDSIKLFVVMCQMKHRDFRTIQLFVPRALYRLPLKKNMFTKYSMMNMVVDIAKPQNVLSKTFWLCYSGQECSEIK